MPTNDGPIAYAGWDRLAADLDNLSAAVEGQPVAEAFLPAVSPGCAAMLLGTTYFGSRRDYLFALADGLREEYRAIVDRGFLLQVDCPDLGLGRHLEFADAPIAEFRANVALHVEALNHALAGIDPERVRVHVCWGNYPGTHHRDVPLRDILDLVYQINASGLSIEGANPRHEHEWAVFAEMPLPDDKVLIPGVIDSCSNYIEHPEVVAQRIERYAGVVGRERVIAGTRLRLRHHGRPLRRRARGRLRQAGQPGGRGQAGQRAALVTPREGRHERRGRSSPAALKSCHPRAGVQATRP